MMGEDGTEVDEEMCLGFVFQDWLDTEMFTEHDAKEVTCLGVRVSQGEFCHTRKNDQTGAVVWDDAVMLARFLTQNEAARERLRGRRVVELGAGTGFLGLALARLCGAHVVISDRPVMGPLIEHNIATNPIPEGAGSCKFVPHSWGEPLAPELVSPDIVVASGCVYHEDANPLLISSLRALAAPITYFAIDFRYDLGDALQPPEPVKPGNKSDDNDEEQYLSPVIKSFLSQAAEADMPLRPLRTAALGLPPGDLKASVRIFECTPPK